MIAIFRSFEHLHNSQNPRFFHVGRISFHVFQRLVVVFRFVLSQNPRAFVFNFGGVGNRSRFKGWAGGSVVKRRGYVGRVFAAAAGPRRLARFIRGHVYFEESVDAVDGSSR